MASEGFTEVDFTCPVCFDFFVNPVVLTCSHSICSACIQAFWESKGVKECPMCRETSAADDPPLNLALKNLCETFQQDRSQRGSSGGGQAVCGAHKEKLKLFCLDDQQAVCLVCRDSKLHTDHRFCPMDEAVHNNKEKLKAVVEQLREKMGIFENFKQTLEQTTDINKHQTQETEEKINKEFEELREILRNEEMARITVLREDEKQKSEMIKEKTKNTSKQIIFLRCALRDVEKQMNAEDDSFLQNFKGTLQRAQVSLPDPGNVSHLLVDAQEYLSDLRPTVLQKIDGSRGEPDVRGAPGIRRGHGSKGGPSVRGDPTSRGGFRGDHTSRGGPGNRGDHNFRGGRNFKEDSNNRGHSNFRGDPCFKEDPTSRGGHNFRGSHNPGGDPGFRGGHSFKGNASFLGDHRGPGGAHRFRGGRNYRGAHNNEGAEEFLDNP
ncbi:tripartite motif-containing protein 12A-like [Puntigrus tetrazona]|uniref:tripartite motif-containing protein 12A-like n=1 Tax=Puntigrus tetrazona TaxID=1606681 RepID=UPI001C8A0BBA|nr:tripartite motif-containing protein 12A-like [Puntigrus tetrazona]